MISVRLLVVCLPLILAGCSSTWSHGEVTPPPGQTAPSAASAAGGTATPLKPTNPSAIILSESDIADRRYTNLGDLYVAVNKLTIFHPDPTRELVNEKFREEAAKIGADAVVLIRYGTVGISLLSWGSIDGRGRAVAFAR